MREIIFRGKKDDDEWVYGSFCMDALEQFNGLCGVDGFIRLYDKGKGKMQTYEVDRETVGQYTGLMDKNGKRIFEGDIVAQNWYDYDEPRDDSFGKVVFCEYDCSFSVMDVNKDGFMPLGRCGSYHWEVEVIGNIHDNPEMLKGGEG